MVRQVLRAAIDELGRAGYPAMRVEDVAVRANVNKTTVYRRWPTKAELVSAAVRATVGIGEPLPDTGSLRGDLVELVKRALDYLSQPDGIAIIRLITIERTDPDIERLAQTLRDEGRRNRVSLIERAKTRGLVPVGVDSYLVTDAIFTPIFTRAIKWGEAIEDDTIVRLVDLVVSGAERGGGQLPS